MNIGKSFYLLSEYATGKGLGQIPDNKIGDAVATIALDYGCDGVVLGFIDPRDFTPKDRMFLEACDARRMQVIFNCPLVGATGPTLAEMHDPAWIGARLTAWRTWAVYPQIYDWEMYRNHPYKKYKCHNDNQNAKVVQMFRDMLASVPFRCEWGWCFGSQNADKLGYAFEVMSDKVVATDEEFDTSAGAWKEPEHVPAKPAPNVYPAWFPREKIACQRRWCSRDGEWIQPGSVAQRSWKFADAKDGILYSDDAVLLANLGL